MKRAPTVSVLITSYNREAFIAETIESVLASTFQDFEVIVVDNASQDRTVEIARSYDDPRIRVYQNETNITDFPNRNRAAGYARGKYIKYVDSDDLVYPHALEVMVRCMERFPEAGLGLSQADDRVRPHPFELSPAEAYRMHMLGRRRIEGAPILTIMRRAAFEAVGGFVETIPFIADGELLLRIAARFPVVLMPAGLTFWRRHANQETSHLRRNESQNILNALQFEVQAVRSRFCPLDEAERSKALARLRDRNVRRSIWHMRKGRLKVGMLLLAQTYRLTSSRATPETDQDVSLMPAAPARALSEQ